MKLVLMVASAALLATPAFAQDAPAPAAAPAKPAPQRERMICREANEIGSLIKKERICMTSAQWRDQAHRQGMDLERREAQRTANGGG